MIPDWIHRMLGWEQANGHSNGARRRAPPTEVEDATNWLFASNELAAELARTRRYEHDLSIVVLSVSPLPEDADPVGAGGRAPAHLARLPHVVFLLTSGALRGLLRQSDIVFYQPAEEQFVIALVEADGEQAHHAIRRVSSLFRTRFSLGVAAGVAAFPHDGLTLPDLVATAVERTQHAELDDALKGSPELVTTSPARDAPRVG